MRGVRLGWLLAVVLGLWLLGAAAEANARPRSGPGARHRHRARPAAAHLVAHRRGLKRPDRKAHRRLERAAPPVPEPNPPADIAFVTITTAAKGTSFYVDSRRVGTGSTVHQPVAPGYHQFQAVHPSGARWQKYLSFDAGDDRELIIHW